MRRSFDTIRARHSAGEGLSRRRHRTHRDRLSLPERGRYPAMRPQPPGAGRARPGEIASCLGVTSSTLSGIRAEAARR